MSIADSQIQNLFANLPRSYIVKLAERHFLWEKHGRPDQLIPAGDWFVWVILAGRFWGKTRTGGEAVRHWAKSFRYVNLIGATADDARDIMIQGESGILAICPKDERPAYQPALRRLIWPSGATSLIFTADEPERLRGKQHEKLWCDEVGSWRYQEAAWDQAMLGLRLGNSPQAVVTTTPKPTPIVRALVADKRNYVTRGTTYDNRQNLAPQFYSTVITKYEGTRLGRQELNAEILEDNPGALWKRVQIDALRVVKIPEMRRVVVAIDPAVTAVAGSDETGMVVCGLGTDKHGYILEDLSLRESPDAWAQKAVNAYRRWKADRIVAEVNNGGDLVETTIRTVDKNVPYKAVHASRGKQTRAEPIAALYEQGRVHHVGSFAMLEDQMCQWEPGQKSPDHLDAMVWGMTELMLGDSGWVRAAA